MEEIQQLGLAATDPIRIELDDREVSPGIQGVTRSRTTRGGRRRVRWGLGRRRRGRPGGGGPIGTLTHGGRQRRASSAPHKGAGLAAPGRSGGQRGTPQASARNVGESAAKAAQGQAIPTPGDSPRTDVAPVSQRAQRRSRQRRRRRRRGERREERGGRERGEDGRGEGGMRGAGRD